MTRCELKRDHAAVGGADKRVCSFNRKMINERYNRVGLVGRINGQVELAVAADPFDCKQPEVAKVE